MCVSHALLYYEKRFFFWFFFTTRSVIIYFILVFIALKGAGVLKRLASQVAKKNSSKTPTSDGEVNAFELSLQTVLDSLKSLAEFKTKHEAQVPILKGMPIDGPKVASLQAQMP